MLQIYTTNTAYHKILIPNIKKKLKNFNSQDSWRCLHIYYRKISRRESVPYTHFGYHRKVFLRKMMHKNSGTFTFLHMSLIPSPLFFSVAHVSHFSLTAFCTFILFIHSLITKNYNIFAFTRSGGFHIFCKMATKKERKNRLFQVCKSMLSNIIYWQVREKRKTSK